MQRQQSKYPSKHPRNFSKDERPPRNYSKDDVKARHNMAPADAARHAIRLSNLKKLAKVFKDEDKLAIALELRPSRLAELLSGRSPVTAEMAMHIEDELHLSGGWLSDPASEYTVKQATARNEEMAASSLGKPPKDKPQAVTPPPTVAKLTLPVKTAAPKTAATKPATAAAPKASAAKKPAPPASKSTPAAAAPAPVQARVSDDGAQQVRRMNMHILTEEKGEKAALARALNVHESLISLKLKSRPLTREFCEGIEEAYGLEAGWMDTPRLDLPEGVKRLGGDLRRGRPVTAKAPEPAPAPAPAAPVRKPAVKAAPAPKVTQQPAPVPAPVAVAAAPQPERRAVAAPAPVAQPAPTSGSATVALFGKMLAETIISRSASGALSYEKLVRIMEDVMA